MCSSVGVIVCFALDIYCFRLVIAGFMQTISEMSESIDINTISTNNVSDDYSLNNCHISTALGQQTPVTTPEPKSVSNPSGSGSRSEIHYPAVQNPSRIYESKKNRKIVRIMTVMGYMFAVSLAAIVLSLYYAFLWNPNMQINNSTHLFAKKANRGPEVVPLRQEADTIGSEAHSDQVQEDSHLFADASAHDQQSQHHRRHSDSGHSDSLVSPPNITATNKRNTVYSSNMLSSNEHKQNVSKLLSKTYQTNVVSVSQQRVANDRKSRNEVETNANPLNESNRTEINIVDNQIEISLNTSQAMD